MVHITTNKTSCFPKTEFYSNISLLSKKDEMLFQFSDLSSIRNPLRDDYLKELEKLNAKYLSKINEFPENNIVLINN